MNNHHFNNNQNPFEVGRKSKSNKSTGYEPEQTPHNKPPDPTEEKITRIVMSIIIIIVIFIGAIAIATPIIENYNYRKVEEVESSYNHQAYLDRQDYPDNVHILATGSDDSNSKYGDTDSYNYVVGTDIESGLYTLEMHALTDQGIAPSIDIYHQDQTIDEAYHIVKDFEDDHDKVYNINLDEGDTVTIQIQHKIPGVIYLIPQIEYVQFSSNPTTYGKFTSPQAIAPGEYFIPDGIKGYLCATEEYSYDDDCDSIGTNGEETIVDVDQGQTLFIDENWRD